MNFYNIFMNGRYSLLTMIMSMLLISSILFNDYLSSIICFILFILSFIFDEINYRKNNS